MLEVYCIVYGVYCIVYTVYCIVYGVCFMVIECPQNAYSKNSNLR